MDKQKLVNVLLELRSASIALGINPSEDDYKKLIHKYDIIFAGNNLNTIYTDEFNHCLKTKFDIDISIEELNQLIPNICSGLNMSYEPFISATDFENPNPLIKCYSIILY